MASETPPSFVGETRFDEPAGLMALLRRIAMRRLVFVQPILPLIAIHIPIAKLRGVDPRRIGLPAPVLGARVHVGAGQNILEGYENIDAYDNTRRASHFKTEVRKFARAEVLDELYGPESVAEIRCHHLFEHISILDVDRTLRAWNSVMRTGGLLWIEVPDFERCARRILRMTDERAKEVYYRHIFGSHMGPGERHLNGLTAPRLKLLLSDYGFEAKQIYVNWARRGSRKPDMYYPADLPLPDLTVKAVKVGVPDPQLLASEWTHLNYRRLYPNRELEQA